MSDVKKNAPSAEPKGNGKKSNAKAAGLKSIFSIKDGELLMTSYDKGSEAKLEKRVVDGKIRDIADKPAFQAAVKPVGHFDIRGRDRVAVVDDPEHRAEASAWKGDDLVHTRPALERRYFNENFRDNIHIQMIHNILDVEKILVLHINNIIYMINNMFRAEGEETDDLMGYISMYGTYEKLTTSIKNSEKDDNSKKKEAVRQEVAALFDKLCYNRRLSYFGLEIINPSKKNDATVAFHQADKGKAQKRKNPVLQLSREEFFYILKVLGQLRQDLAHGQPSKVIFRQYLEPVAPSEKKEKVELTGSMDDMLALLKQKINSRQSSSEPKKAPAPQSTPDMTVERILTSLYQNRVDDLNKGFTDKARVNLTLLFTALGITDPEQKKKLVEDYYEFTVCKSFKNLGFSIKLLREHMATEIPDAAVIKSMKYDTVRGKLNPFLDFVIFRHYDGQEERKLDLVARLRASEGEADKERIYSEEAQKLWPEIKDLVLHHILPQLDGDLIGEVKKHTDPEIDRSLIDEVAISSKAFFFSKLIYLMTIFLNGKEINDLLTTLIHQFESIASFQAIMKAENMPYEVIGKFDIFNESKAAAKQLRLINSFARMRQEDPFTKEVMFREAVDVLGYSISDSEMDQVSKEIMDPKASEKGSPNRGIRNFIINNVITSDRFLYLARYSNVKKVRALVQNRELVRYILADIPDEQIVRYYSACADTKGTGREQMREVLADAVCALNFDSLKDVNQKADARVNLDKQRKIAIVRLYLTVLYLVVKNLVYINSRYFLAFHCVERDRLLLNPDFWKDANKEENRFKDEYGYAAFARWFVLEQYPPKSKRVADYMAQNFANADDWAIRTFRNKVDHLDAIRNVGKYIEDVKKIHSWYELYQYVMQRRIREQFDFDAEKDRKDGTGKVITREDVKPKTWEYFGKVETYGNYCKDFVKALNVPFAYNLPRYKNLAIDELFDKNKPLVKEKKTGKNLENEE